MNQADSFGYTPLHMAALNEFSNYVLLLLAHGGDVTARTRGNVSVLSFIVRRTPDVLPKFVQRLDQAVRLHDHEIGDVDCELKVRVIGKECPSVSPSCLYSPKETLNSTTPRHAVPRRWTSASWCRTRTAARASSSWT